MTRLPDGPPPAPVAQRLRLRYAKRGRLRFASHRDFQRAFERAIRRAGLPIAYSAGFNPHPKISYTNAAPTGAASEAEYLEFALTSRRSPQQVRQALDAALPPGLDVVEVVEAGTRGLADRLQGSVWQVELPGTAPATVAAAVNVFLACPRIEVQRMTKSGLRTFDVRSAAVSLRVRGSGQVPESSAGQDAVDSAVNGTSASDREREDRVARAPLAPCAILQVVVRHTTPAVRPDDILAAFRSQADLAPPSPPRMTRLAQGPLDEEGGSVADPLAADRGVGGV